VLRVSLPPLFWNDFWRPQVSRMLCGGTRLVGFYHDGKPANGGAAKGAEPIARTLVQSRLLHKHVLIMPGAPGRCG
jgi:hypothetical protein